MGLQQLVFRFQVLRLGPQPLKPTLPVAGFLPQHEILGREPSHLVAQPRVLLLQLLDFAEQLLHCCHVHGLHRCTRRPSMIQLYYPKVADGANPSFGPPTGWANVYTQARQARGGAWVGRCVVCNIRRLVVCNINIYKDLCRSMRDAYGVLSDHSGQIVITRKQCRRIGMGEREKMTWQGRSARTENVIRFSLSRQP